MIANNLEERETRTLLNGNILYNCIKYIGIGSATTQSMRIGEELPRVGPRKPEALAQ